MLAFEESATGAGTTIIKVRIPSQGRALCTVAPGGVEGGRANVEVGGGAELMHPEAGGGEGEPERVI
jgi:hypothetical protein